MDIQMNNPLSEPLRLPGGAILANRLAKAAMSEGMADATTIQRRALRRCTVAGRVPARGCFFPAISRSIGGTSNARATLSLMTTAGRRNWRGSPQPERRTAAHFWAQLSHTGRQVQSGINTSPLAPSSVDIDVIRGAGFSFATPREMTEEQIQQAIGQFAFAAGKVREAGFTGVSLHGAHGYLISQFLSPLANKRTDRWGGSLENRSRFVLEVLAAVRSAVGPDFPVAIKLNSSDFQKGGLPMPSASNW